mmetsp:Transcript_2392/g.9946  ORF Transcript_2392/g.9946 Transcript_2392/m.9946 type:complete len:209 (-) Transcript_2392:12-638(-)
MTCRASFMLRWSKLHARARSARVVRPKKNEGSFFLVLSSCLPNPDSGPQSAGRCDVSIAIMRCVSRVRSCGSSVDIPGPAVSPPPKRDIVAYPPETDIARGDVFSRPVRQTTPEELPQGRGDDHARLPRVAGAIVGPLAAAASARDVKGTRGCRTTRMYREDARGRLSRWGRGARFYTCKPSRGDVVFGFQSNPRVHEPASRREKDRL